jgi:predicted membrane protein
MLTILGMLVLFSTSVLAFFHPFGAIAQLCLLAAVWFYRQPWSHMAAIASLFFFAMINWLVFILLMYLILREFLHYLEKRRINKLKKLAKMTPQQIAGISKDEPAIEVIMRGEKK